MEQFINQLSERLYTEIDTVEQNENSIMKRAEQIVLLLERAFEDIKSFVSTYIFADEQEEIRFFKEIKPKLFSKLIYYKKIYNIEMMRPVGGIETHKNHLETEQQRIKHYFDRNIDFYKYYRSGNTHLDKFYFTRGRPDIRLTLDSFYFERDSHFSSCYDFTVAKILANDMLTVYITEELIRIDNQHKPESMINSAETKSDHTWTDSKTSLVELIYAIHSKGSIDHGNIDIKEIASFFCQVLNIDLGDFYRTYLAIKGRKKNRTDYLSTLIDRFTQRMDEDDE